MSAAGSAIAPCFAAQNTATHATTINPRWLVVGTAFAVGLAFFIATHDTHVSLAVSYTQNAEEMEIAAAGGNTLRRVAFLMLGAWGAILFAAGRQRVHIDPLLAGSLVLLLGLAGFSFLWADEPGMCLRRLFVLACCVTAAVGMARALSLREICWLTVGTLGSLALVGVLAEIRFGTFRPWAGDYRFAGTVHPNSQGPGLATLCLAALALTQENTRNRAWLWIAFAIAFGLLLLTKSRTTAAAVIASIGAVQLVRLPLATKCLAATVLGWLAAVGLLAVCCCGLDPLNDFRDVLLLGRAEEADTLSGRAFIWPEVLSFANQRFWLGYGYESFCKAGRIETISDELGWGLREAHKGYLEILLAIVLVGVVL
jgi:exopolysaccharide production protein ExoQ